MIILGLRGGNSNRCHNSNSRILSRGDILSRGLVRMPEMDREGMIDSTIQRCAPVPLAAMRRL